MSYDLTFCSLGALSRVQMPPSKLNDNVTFKNGLMTGENKKETNMR